MTSLSITLTDVVLLAFLLMLSIPLPVCFVSALLFLSLSGDVSMKTMLIWIFSQPMGTVLLASPLFILTGMYIGGSRMTKHLLDHVDTLAGYIKSGLGVVVALVCAIMGAILESGFMGVVVTGPIMALEMEEQGYPGEYATVLMTVSSVPGLLIPPSAVMIIFGWVTECSILTCFLSILDPGLTITTLPYTVHAFQSRQFNLKATEKKPFEELTSNAGKMTFKAMPTLIMPLIILGGTYGGVFTPTEVTTMTAIHSTPIGSWVYKACIFKGLLAMTKEVTSIVGSTMVMIVCCLMLSRVFTVYCAPELVLELLTSTTTNKYMLLLTIDILLLIVGMIANDTTGVLTCAPLLMPIMNQLGVSSICFVPITGVNPVMGRVMPPYASILCLGMRIGKAGFHEILKSTMTFLIPGYVPIVFLVTYWPDLAPAIPRMAGLAVQENDFLP